MFRLMLIAAAGLVAHSFLSHRNKGTPLLPAPGRPRAPAKPEPTEANEI